MRDNYMYRGVKGMRDIFPEESYQWQQCESKAHSLFKRYGFGEMRTPVVEHTSLFERGIGQGTDIVNKEMFYVPAKEQDGDESAGMNRKMVLRPEATASVVRAYIEHEVDKKSPGVQRYYYIGPMFRYERPQRGRYRQFTQVGVEMLGTDAPSSDAEAIILLHDFLSEVGVRGIRFQVNSVGCSKCRPDYIRKLQEHVRPSVDSMCPDCQGRVDKNPLRLFDCKKTQCRQWMQTAPTIQGDLCEECKSHQDLVLGLLTKAGIAYQIEARLMRGLDYYTRTVFEVVSENLGAQNAVAAGGRYNNLVAELDGPATPAIGWSVGLERLMELLPEGCWEKEEPHIYVVAPGQDWENTFLRVIELRRRGLRVGLDHETKSVKALMKRADKLGAHYALFVSRDEPETVELKHMETGHQQKSAWDKIPALVLPND